VVEALLLVAAIVAVPLGLATIPDDRATGAAAGSFSSLLALPAAALLVAAFVLPAGSAAALLTTPWLVVAGTGGLGRLVRFAGMHGRLRPSAELATDFAVAFLLAGAVFLAAERLGVALFGFPATLVLLAAVHYHVAGFVLVLAGTQAWRLHPAKWLAVAVALVIVGIPVTALGFFGMPIVNWAGAMLVSSGGLGIGLAHLVAARTTSGVPSVLLGIAGLSLLVSIPLAIVFATALLLGVDGPDLTFMARTHGGLNVVGFAVPAMMAWAWMGRRTTSSPAPAEAA
jgi:hypothetical protein